MRNPALKTFYQSESAKFYKKLHLNHVDSISFSCGTFDREIYYPLSALEREQKRSKEATDRGLREDTRFLLFVGTLHPQNDPLLLLNAFSQTADPRAHLLIAGNGELESAMVAKVKQLGIADRVTFLGALTHNEVADYHRLTSALVLIRAYEGLPLVVLEALACGTPIVTTNTGEISRLLHSNCGIVCQEPIASEIAIALDTVLQFPERFPSEACVGNALPYSAKNVVKSICAGMFKDCQPSQPAYQKSAVSI